MVVPSSGQLSKSNVSVREVIEHRFTQDLKKVIKQKSPSEGDDDRAEPPKLIMDLGDDGEEHCSPNSFY